MSLDLIFQPCRYVGAPAKTTDRFTGEVRWQVPNQPLTSTELKAVESVLEKHTRIAENLYHINTKDGGFAEVDSNNLERGCMVVARFVSPGLVQFLFDLLKAGNWVATPIMEENITITVSPQDPKMTPKTFLPIVECHSADELHALLVKGGL